MYQLSFLILNERWHTSALCMQDRLCQRATRRYVDMELIYVNKQENYVDDQNDYVTC